MAEHDKIVQEVNQRNQRLNASERRDDEYMEMISEFSMEPTKAFNQNGAHTLFQEVFKVLIGTACKLHKEHEKCIEMCRTLSLNAAQQKKHEESRKLKRMVDEMLSHFANIIKDFRYYDKYLLIEADPWTVQKICKLSVLERTYFQIFHDQLTQILPVSKDFQSQVKLSLYHRMKQWFTDRYNVDDQGKIEVRSFLTLDHVILIFGLLQSPHQRLKLRNVFQVAV
jgi:hemerythrin